MAVVNIWNTGFHINDHIQTIPFNSECHTSKCQIATYTSVSQKKEICAEKGLRNFIFKKWVREWRILKTREFYIHKNTFYIHIYLQSELIFLSIAVFKSLMV